MGDRPGAADCHDSLGLVHYTLGDFRLATRHYEQSLAIRAALRDHAAESECYKSLGTAYIRMEDTEVSTAPFVCVCVCVCVCVSLYLC